MTDAPKTGSKLDVAVALTILLTIPIAAFLFAPVRRALWAVGEGLFILLGPALGLVPPILLACVYKLVEHVARPKRWWHLLLSLGAIGLVWVGPAVVLNVVMVKFYPFAPYNARAIFTGWTVLVGAVAVFRAGQLSQSGRLPR